ncbi:MAG: rhomboid family intramembrane serine protease [Phormidesmis sp. CAN_BIN36]|nr:rhomboid family intramembrane serine protease [Phormidesmis sp. CAN_BIN36]
MENDVSRVVINGWFYQLRFLIYLVVIAWVVAVINFGLLGKALNRLGLAPRTLTGIPGILISPFLHVDWQHLEGNTVFYFIFGGLVFLREPSDFGAITGAIAVISGVVLWLVGRPGIYVGASDVIFGYIGFLLSFAYFDRNLSSVLVLIITVMLVVFTQRFGHTLWLVMPIRQGMAWDGHLIGLLTGILVARHLPILKGWFDQLIDSLNRLGSSLM